MSKSHKRKAQKRGGQRARQRNLSKPGAGTGSPPDRRRRFHFGWTPVERSVALVGGAGALVGLIAAASGFIGHLHSRGQDSPLKREEKLISQLEPGEDHMRLQQIIGTQADYVVRLQAGITLYQYERKWDTVQLVVVPGGQAISVGIYAKTPLLQPSIPLGPDGPRITLNTRLSRSILRYFTPDRMNAYCGAHKAGYIETYDNMPNVDNEEDIAVGISSAESVAIKVSPICSSGNLLTHCQSSTSHFLSDNQVDSGYAKCMLGSPAGQRIHRNLIPSVLIMTAPMQKIIPDMLYPPDEVIGLSSAGTQS